MRSAHAHFRRAYTLMEVILVMALVLVVAGISVPVIQTMMDDARQTAAIDMVRAKTAETRARAMESGVPWRLAYIPNTGVFQLAPDDSTDWESMEQPFMEKEGLYRDTLPKGIVFGVNAGDIIGASEAGAAGSEWHTIGVYNYEGSAREDSITYFGKAGIPPMAIELRGLTGTPTMRTPSEVMAMQP